MKVLVRAPNWVGDAVLSLPALHAVRRRWPEAEIVVVARPWVADLYGGRECVDRIARYDVRGEHRGWFGRERLVRELRRERFDLAVLFQNAFDAAWIAWRAEARERIGYARDCRSLLLTQAIPIPRPGEVPAHECYYYLELLRRAGWLETLPEISEISIRISASARERARQSLLRAGARTTARWIAFAPGAAYGSARCWPPERYAELANRLIADFHADVILFGTASERETCARIAASTRAPAVNLAGDTQVGDLPALIAACELFVGNDSGAMHVAAASGIPVVAIFGPTDPEGTAPMTPRRTLVRRSVSCSPCFLRRCPVDHRCLARIEVEDVYAAARVWLEAERNG